MKKMIWFALLLAGCSVRRPYVADTPSLPIVKHDSESASAAVVETRHEVERPAPMIDPPLAPIGKKPSKTEDESIAVVNGLLEDAFFAYDRSELSPEALAALRKDAGLLCAILADFPGVKIVLEGHCDERGSAEYNLALGDRRARRADEVLRAFGVPDLAVEIVSYGKEAPQCVEANEECRQKNRRAHLSVRQ
jgi:peptidoglycan-associated lipoprotein